MDPIFDVDHEGTGTMTVYAYGKTWRCSLFKWTLVLYVDDLAYQAPDSQIVRLMRSRLSTHLALMSSGGYE